MYRKFRAFRFRIYPTRQQEEQFAKTFGCCRFIYNRMLADKIAYYNKNGKMLRTLPAHYKAEFPWLKEVDSLALANVQQHLERTGGRPGIACECSVHKDCRTRSPHFYAKRKWWEYVTIERIDIPENDEITVFF